MLCGIDCDERARKTYEENNLNGADPVPFLDFRVEDLAPETLADILEPYQESPVLFVGCPPCQPFTNLRTDKERSKDSQGALTSFIDHVVDQKPDFVLVENVPGIQAEKYDKLWDTSLDRLRSAGFKLRYEIINAARYGVPQKRLRTMLVAARNGEPPWPSQTHKPGDYRTFRDAVSGPGLLCGPSLCRLEAGEQCEHDPLQVAASLSELNQKRIQAISKPGGSRTEWPPELELACYQDHTGHTDVYGRMDWDRPSPTLTTRFVSLSNGRFGHPEQDRAITPREGALLQSFPPDYQFLAGSRGVNAIHIGNAVPPRLAGAFVGAIADSVRANGTS